MAKAEEYVVRMELVMELVSRMKLTKYDNHVIRREKTGCDEKFVKVHYLHLALCPLRTISCLVDMSRQCVSEPIHC